MSDTPLFPWLKAYPEGVRPRLEYPKQPLYVFLEEAARRYPERAAVVFFGKKFSYEMLWEKAARLAAALSALGVGKGDRVAVMLPNCPQAVISYYGILRLGAIVVPVHPQSVERELAQQLGDVGCRVIICLDTRFDRINAVREEVGLQTCIVTGLQEYMPPFAAVKYKHQQRRRGRQLGVPAAPSVYGLGQMLEEAHAPLPEVKIEPKEDLAVLQFTGGTTGSPKAAMLTHFNLVANTLQIREWFTGHREGHEVFLAVLPFSHVYGMTVAMNFAVQLAATMVVMPRFNAEQALWYIERHKVTIFPGTPAMFAAINSFPKAKFYDLSSLRICVSGAAALSPETATVFEQITGSALVEGYGLTEASPVTHCNPLRGKRKVGSVGLPLPDTECRIVDLENGTRDIPVGVAGELVIRGPQVMKGYWNRPKDTAETLRDGWLYTGDIARLDKSGYTYIVDRKKDLIISGGYNIYPQDIEAVLLELPQVADVAVVGLPDRFRGETLKAYIVLREGEALSKEQVLEHCSKRLTSYKVPRIIEFRKELPKNIVGKTLRRMLLEEEKNRPRGFECPQ